MSSPSGSRARTRRPAERKPREFILRTGKTRRLHLPRVDFNDIRVGAKTEYRNYGTRLFDELAFPCPAVGYCQRPWWTVEHGLDGIDTVLLTLEDSWVEPLGAISEESLEREGFDGITDFRRYFAERYPKGGFRALANVIVYRVRPMTEADEEQFRADLWNRIYGQWR